VTTLGIDRNFHGLRLVYGVSEQAGPEHGASDADMVRLHFTLCGDYRVDYPTLGRSFERLAPHCSLFYARPFELEYHKLSPRLETFGLQFPVARFLEYADGASPAVSRFCEQIAHGSAGFLVEPSPLLISTFEPSVRRMLDCRYQGSVEELYLYSQSLELLARALDLAADSGEKRLARGDRERLFAARDLLDARLADPPVLADVARHVGLNEHKLKRGFKQLFGVTVHTYFTHKRLELARSLLLDTERTAAEIAFALGYASPQHFSQAFKQHFGVAPKSMRKSSDSAMS
jgi:AraC family transcriptional regulator, transcriptional activator of the genes for pyochelin and ferripyochelin receptors